MGRAIRALAQPGEELACLVAKFMKGGIHMCLFGLFEGRRPRIERLFGRKPGRPVGRRVISV